ncbi:MAG TPA: hydantoinase/oxoprolinase family protein [Rhodopila sp.]|uniref:hydantoinase/oxoprolinase family protein n=1 Tax=Rhodopila sp. TaxID=2480087 RepID=UPI002CAE8038|nr:hydantoinase/oxoprolinase family protein [Rhodopila sp.]HVY14265.1 hydantoinase/oxoprolinase family protein [Rhodopila sp.]
MTARTRLAVDIGGTFTDLVLSLPDRTVSAKLLTTHDAPDAAVIDGTRAILAEAGITGADLDLVVHGTTLATNALIERKGARTALITTRGFRDSLEIAYEHRFEQYDLYMERPTPLTDRDLRLEVPERMAADGSVLLALDEAALMVLVDTLKARRIEAVAISFLHSYVNPAHEERARDLLAAAMPELAITLSSEVCREIREYERTSTTVANAYVLPLMASYLGRMRSGFAAIGVTCPLLLMMSSGGICTIETAQRFPVRLVESGPAGGVILARRIAAQGGYSRALSFDMGGTTAKITLIDDFTPQQSRHFEVARAYRFAKGSGIPVRIPVIDMVEIGAGGGSIARVDALRRIAVGPDSAGSDPGPACYGRSGSAPTVTDADVVLGRIDPAGFAGGKLNLWPELAEQAVIGDVGGALGMDVEEAARGIAEIVDETMASAARVHAVENGKDTAERTLIAFGGAAPLHAARLAQKLGIGRVVIPVDAGVGSAHGFLDAPIAYEVVRTALMRLDGLDQGAVDALFADMRAEAETVVRLGYPEGPLAERRVAFMRYRGQGHEIAVTIDGALDPAALRAAFEATYAQLFGRVIPRLEIEAVTWTLALSQPYALPEADPPPPMSEPASPTGLRRLVESASGETVDAPVYDRRTLGQGATLKGPAAITEAGTTTIVPSGFTARIALGGEIIIEGGVR